MTIRIHPRHPALRYVLNRTAPVGMTVRAEQQTGERDPMCQIEIESSIDEVEAEARILEAWLLDPLSYYGARAIHIDGRAVRCAEDELRRALRPAARRRSRRIAVTADCEPVTRAV